MRITECINDADLDRRTILIPAEINKGKKDRAVFYSQTMVRYCNHGLVIKIQCKIVICCF